MKTTKSLLLTLLLAAGFSSSVYAGHYDYEHDRRGYQPPRHHHHQRHWGGVAAGVVIGGLVGATIYHNAHVQPVIVAPPPRPVITPPPSYAAPAPGVWYYCASVGQYYPYVRYCREGWQAVAPQ